MKETEVKARNANVFEEVEGEVTSTNSTEKNMTLIQIFSLIMFHLHAIYLN